jgi:hypothetical protein
MLWTKAWQPTLRIRPDKQAWSTLPALCIMAFHIIGSHNSFDVARNAAGSSRLGVTFQASWYRAFLWLGCEAAGSRSFFRVMQRLRMHGALTLFLIESYLFFLKPKYCNKKFCSCLSIRFYCRIHKSFLRVGRGLGLCSNGVWGCCFTGWFVYEVSRPPCSAETSGSYNPVTRYHAPEEQRLQLYRRGRNVTAEDPCCSCSHKFI